MADADIHLVTRWRVFGTIHEVADVLGDVSAMTRWWPSAYLGIEVLERGDAHGGGAVACVCTRGWPSRTWLWQFEITESRYPHGLSIEARGDIVGHGTWALEQDGPRVNVILDWSMRVDRPMARFLSPLLKPILRLNHRWAMARGEEGLGLELARRRLISRIEPSIDRPRSSCHGRDDDRGRMLDEW